MFMRQFSFLLMITCLLFSGIYAQSNNVAEFAGRSLTADEFLKRFELTPRVISSSNIDTQKTHFLFTLIAEKLWAEEARRQNLDTLYSYREYSQSMEKMLARDALFKREIESKVNITKQEVENALYKKRHNLYLNFLFSKSKEEIDSLYYALKTTGIDSLLKHRNEKHEQVTPIKVEFGQMRQELEDSLYNLSIGEFTKPIQSEIGWVIYYLADKIELSGPQIGTIESAASEVKKVLLDRQRKNLMQKYLGELLSGVNVNTDGQLFTILADALFNIYKQKDFTEETTVFFLYEEDLIKLIDSVPGKFKDEVFIKFAENPVDLKEFLYYIYFKNFKSPGLSKQAIRSSLKSAIDEYIESELIAREAYKQNLNLVPEVQNELQMWKDNFLSQYLRNTYNQDAKVSESELENYVSQMSDSVVTSKLVSITEVKLNNLDQAQFIFRQLQLGINFDQIIQNMKLSPGSVFQSDSLEPITAYPELAEIISDLKIGQVYGPVIRANGYSIIRLNEAKEVTLTALQENKLQLENNRELLYYKKLRSILTEKTIEFAEKYNLQVNEEVLADLKTTEIPSLIYRYYGFGGQTVAAPFLNLFYDWFNKYKKEKENPL